MNNRRLVTIPAVLSLALVPTLAACGGDSGSDIQSVEVVWSSDRAPYVLESGGEEFNLMRDLFAYVEEDHGIESTWTLSEFSGMMPAVQSGRADAIVDNLFVTEERAESVDFTQPLYGWSDRIIKHASDNEVYAELDDLSGLVVGVMDGSVQYEELSQVDGVDVRTYPDYPTLLMEVSAGRVDAGLVDPPSIQHALDNDSSLQVQFDEVFEGTSMQYVAWAVDQGDSELLEILDETITALKDDGTLREMVTFHLGEQVEVPTGDVTP